MTLFSSCDRPSFFDSFSEIPICVKYNKAPVWFLLSQRGRAIEIHIGTNCREGKRALREAGRAIIEHVRVIDPECKQLIAPVISKAVYNLCIKLGFKDLGTVKTNDGYTRLMVVDYGRLD
jgi:hypothetical protein